MSDLSAYARHVLDVYLIPIGLRVLIAIAIFMVGRAIARALLRGLDRVMERSKVDASLRKFLGDIAYAVLTVAVVIASLDMIGVETTAVVAVLGAAGLAVGLALQGSLSNFAAGVMLIILRPYKVADMVVLGKYTGRIEAIRVFHTVMVTDDHREITIPNGQIIAAPIENLTALGKRRVDLVVTITEATDLERVKGLLTSAVAAESRFDPTPAASVEVAEVSDTGAKLVLRPWAAADTYGEAAAALLERLRGALAAAGVKFTVKLAPVA